MKNRAFKRHTEQLSSEELAKIYQKKIVDNNLIDPEKITDHIIDRIRSNFDKQLNKLMRPDVIRFENTFEIRNIKEQNWTFEDGKLPLEDFTEIAESLGIEIKKKCLSIN